MVSKILPQPANIFHGYICKQICLNFLWVGWVGKRNTMQMKMLCVHLVFLQNLSPFIIYQWQNKETIFHPPFYQLPTLFQTFNYFFKIQCVQCVDIYVNPLDPWTR